MDRSHDLAARFRPREGLDISPGRWPDVSRVFAAAIERDRIARASYLDVACRDDPALRAAVDSLLGAYDAAGSFGEDPVRFAGEPAKRLTPGSQLGSFRIEAFVGAGGMGEVYRAHDAKLERAVALKVLPGFFADDADRRARFEEEARALAALNHPHVGAIYGLEESGEVAALVLELVEGPTLAELLAGGPLSMEDTLRLARQLAEGLEAAHERGIIHRDLKPANIKVTPDGNAKILDFGLAKANGGAPAALTALSPGSRAATAVGAIVGTARYMSPEQARGQAVDKRTDVWAYGCVVFEMCTGQPPFPGDTVADTLRAVIEREPDWTLLPASTPPALARVLRRCLIKDPKARLRDIGEARIGLSAEAVDDTAPVRRLRPRVAVAATVVAGLAAAVAAGAAIYRSWFATPPARVQFEVWPPESSRFHAHPGQTSFALSPDGSTLAFISAGGSDPLDPVIGQRIWLRSLDDAAAEPVPGTENASTVFWSADGRSLAFVAGRRLMRIDLPARAVVKICDVTDGPFRHGTWGAGNTILLGMGHGTAIEGVSAAGGVLEPVLRADGTRNERRVHWPVFLPDGERFLYTARLDNGEGMLRLGRLDGTSTQVMPAASNTQWVEPDLVLFVREGALLGQRLDVEGARPIGEPFPIAEGIAYFLTTSRAKFSASRTGAVAFHRGTDLRQLMWLDGNGRELGHVGAASDYHPFAGRLSRDDSRLLTTRARPGTGTHDIWLLDLVRGSEARVTTGEGTELSPIWMEGERAILYGGDSSGTVPHLFRKDLVTNTEEALLPPGNQQYPMGVLPGNRGAVFVEAVTGGFKMFMLPLDPPGAPQPLLHSPQIVAQAQLSPDRLAIAFQGIESSRRSAFIGSIGGTDPPVLITQDVRGAPRWSRDGRLVFFVTEDDTMMRLAVRTSPGIEVGEPRAAFKVRPGSTLLDITRDGRFLLLVPQKLGAEQPILVDTGAARRRE